MIISGLKRISQDFEFQKLRPSDVFPTGCLPKLPAGQDFLGEVAAARCVGATRTAPVQPGSLVPLDEADPGALCPLKNRGKGNSIGSWELSREIDTPALKCWNAAVPNRTDLAAKVAGTWDLE